jgi:hypothetical protein
MNNMISYNDDVWGRVQPLGFVLNSLLPRVYAAVSVRDFIENRDKIRQSSLNLGTILPEGLGGHSLEFMGRSLVHFNNVDLYFEERLWTISDLTGSCNLEYDPILICDSAKQISEGRQYEVKVLHQPHPKMPYIYAIRKFGPEEPEKSLDSKLATAFSRA